MQQQKLAVDSGYWPLFRYNPAEAAEGRPPLVIDSKPAKISLKDYAYRETRYRMLASIDPVQAARLLKEAQQDVEDRWKRLVQMAGTAPAVAAAAPPVPAAASPATVPVARVAHGS
jgi:pyruvate-ferredoxin/flavodoxin oxidoreductase